MARRLKDLDRTGIPAVRAFVRGIGAREQLNTALDLLQPLLAQVTSALNILNAVETPAVEAISHQKQALMKRWASFGSSGMASTHDPGMVDYNRVADL